MSVQNYGKKAVLFGLLICLPFMLCQCYLWSAHKNMKNIRKEIEYLEGSDMTGAAQYHLTIAQNLLDAAETQYEAADFAAANNFARQAQAQLERVRTLHKIQKQTEPLNIEDFQ